LRERQLFANRQRDGENVAGVNYLVTVDSTGGGELQVPVSADGRILGAG